MKKTFAVTAAIALLCMGSLAQAVVIDTVSVGDPGNAADSFDAGYGSVSYTYNIGKYEVTTAQYADFLNHKAQSDPYGMWSSFMAATGSGYLGCNIQRSGVSGSYSYSVGSGSSGDVAAWGNRPVNYVSFWDSCRFANWLANGQGTGDTETGTYILGGYNGTDGRTIQRSAAATWAVTSRDEWYKAAYYKGDGMYSLYANGANTAPAPGTDSNYSSAIGSTWDGTVNGALEQNGTKDMMGNVWEWNDTIPLISGSHVARGVGGGSFADVYGALTREASVYNYNNPTLECLSYGFRVSAVPEPSSLIALAGGLVGLLGMRRRRA